MRHAARYVTRQTDLRGIGWDAAPFDSRSDVTLDVSNVNEAHSVCSGAEDMGTASERVTLGGDIGGYTACLSTARCRGLLVFTLDALRVASLRFSVDVTSV